MPAPQARLEDLSEAAVDRFREEARRSGRLDAALLAEPTPALVDRLHLRERAHLKRAALLLFHPDPEVFFTGAYVKIGFFRDNVDLLYHDEIHGDLFAQVAQTIDLLSTKYLRAGIRYEGIRRVESFPVPGNALREAVLNAVVHKDYASGATVQISVYDDKLMIWNPGQLPPDWKGRRPTGEARVEAVQPRRGARVLSRGPGRGVGTRHRPHPRRLPSGGGS